MASNENENWYLVLELPFDPPETNESVISERIEEKRKFWSSKYNDFKMGRQYKTWVENIPQIKADMIGADNKRYQIAKEACEIFYGVIDRYIDDIENDGCISRAEAKKIAEKAEVTFNVVANRLKAKRITLNDDTNSDSSELYEQYYQREPSALKAYQILPELLKVYNTDDLYSFLISDVSVADKDMYRSSQLINLTQKKRNEFVGNDSKSSTGQKLCSVCEQAFSSEQSKKEYDEYALFIARRKIFDSIRTANEISGKVKAKKVEGSIQEMSKLYSSDELAQNIIYAFMEHEKMYYERPNIQKQSKAKPTPSPQQQKHNPQSNNNASNKSEIYANIRKLMQHGLYYQAEQLLEKNRDNLSAEWNYLKGLMCKSKGDANTAYFFYQTATKLDPQNREYKAAFEQLQSGTNGSGNSNQRTQNRQAAQASPQPQKQAQTRQAPQASPQPSRSSQAYSQQQNTQQDEKSSGLIILLLWLFFPLGLYYMWKYKPSWSSTTKKVVTFIFLGLTALVVINTISDKNKSKDNSSSTAEIAYVEC